MEESFLNLSHKQARKAQECIRVHKFDEAIDLYNQTISNLDQVIKNCKNEKTKEILKLQRNYYLRQIDFLPARKRHYQHVEEMDKCIPSVETLKALDNALKVQESLFANLDKRNELMEATEKRLLEDNDPVPDHVAKCFAELKALNNEASVLVYELVRQLDDKMFKDKNKDSSTLKDTTSFESHNAMLLSDSDLDLNRLEELPALPPLELPKFDFASLSNEDD